MRLFLSIVKRRDETRPLVLRCQQLLLGVSREIPIAAVKKYRPKNSPLTSQLAH